MPVIDSNRNIDSLDNERDEMTLKQRLNHLRKMFDEEAGSGIDAGRDTSHPVKPNYVASPNVPEVSDWGYKIEKDISD